MEPQLTARQAEILEVIRNHVAETGMPPSRPELAKILGIASTNGVFKHLVALAKKGAIELVPNAARGIRVLETGLRQGIARQCGCNGQCGQQNAFHKFLP